MESLTEQIAGEIGKKWVQLFTRLGLGDRARDRYQIVVEHKDDPKLCTRDTIRLTSDPANSLYSTFDIDLLV